MDNDGIETDAVEKGQGRREYVEFVREHRAAHFNHGEFLGLDTAKVSNVLLYFFARSNIVEELDDRVLS